MRRTVFCLLAASFVLAADAAARAHTGSVGGTVFDSNGRPSPNAEVLIERSDGSAPVATRTDSDGRFLFRFVLAGYYDVRASRGSTATIWKHNIMVHAGKETAVDLRLEPIHSARAK
jgi:protocatechuate 3,4-dioxygenase beta subunit